MRIVWHIMLLVLVGAGLHVILAITGLKPWGVGLLELVLTATGAVAIACVELRSKD